MCGRYYIKLKDLKIVLLKYDISLFKQLINWLGFCLSNGTSFYKESKANGFKDSYLEKSGLIIFNEGKVIHRFRERVIFPIKSFAKNMSWNSNFRIKEIRKGHCQYVQPFPKLTKIRIGKSML